MLVLTLANESKLTGFKVMRNNTVYETNRIECISNSLENKGYLKPLVVLWEYYVRFRILRYLRERRMQGRFAEGNRLGLGAFPDVGNEGCVLVAITMIAKCEMKNTRSDRYTP